MKLTELERVVLRRIASDGDPLGGVRGMERAQVLRAIGTLMGNGAVKHDDDAGGYAVTFAGRAALETP